MMRSSLFTYSRSLLYTALVCSSVFDQANAAFAIPSRLLVSARVDPIVNPGVVAGHVHNVVGGSNFHEFYDHDDQVASQCTTTGITIDSSNYWAPALYYLNYSSSDTSPMFHRVPSRFVIWYFKNSGPSNVKVNQFPKGLKMLAGSASRSTHNPDSNADKAASFECLDGSGANAGDFNEFPPHACPDGLKARIWFPSCWNGQDLDSSDHKSHLAYPIQDFADGDCPSTHPVRLVTLFYEQIFSVGDFPYNGGSGKPTWAFSTGDTTGYSNHADFTNGWDLSNDDFQRAIDTCDDPSGDLSKCRPLRRWLNNDQARNCKPAHDMPMEDVDGPLAALPGDNGLWSSSSPKVPSSSPPPPPPFGNPQQGNENGNGMPAGWEKRGCVQEPWFGIGRALKQERWVPRDGMDQAKCVKYCDSKGYGIAGVEYGRECYCDNKWRDGSFGRVVDDRRCFSPCSGDSSQTCGGPWHLTTFVKSGSNVKAKRDEKGCDGGDHNRALFGR